MKKLHPLEVAKTIQKGISSEKAVKESAEYKTACKLTREGAIGAYQLMAGGIFPTQADLIVAMQLDKRKDKDLISRMIKLGEILLDITDAQLAKQGEDVLTLKVIVHKNFSALKKAIKGKTGEQKAEAIKEVKETAKATRKARPNSGIVSKSVDIEKLTDLFCEFILGADLEKVEAALAQVTATWSLRKKNESQKAAA